MPCDTAEDLLLLLQIAQHRVAEQGVAVVVDHAGPRAAYSRALDAKLDETARLRLRHRQRLEQHLLEKREDRRGRADRNREHADDGNGESRPDDELTDRLPDVHR